MTDKTQLLFEWGDPRKRERYNSYHDWDDYLQYGFTHDDVPTLIELLHDEELREAFSDTNEVWVPLYAWRILGQLKSSDAIDALLEAVEVLVEDDWAQNELPVALGMIGEPALPVLSDILLNDEKDEYDRVAASDALEEMVKHYPELRGQVIDHFQEYLLAPTLDLPEFNGLMVSNLINLQATELIGEIRELFANDGVDITICGDLEDVEINLGLRTERSTPKPNYSILSSAETENMKELMQHYLKKSSDNDKRRIRFEHIAPSAEQETYARETPKAGRNDPCPCGSGKKYKRCCL